MLLISLSSFRLAPLFLPKRRIIAYQFVTCPWNLDKTGLDFSWVVWRSKCPVANTLLWTDRRFRANLFTNCPLGWPNSIRRLSKINFTKRTPFMVIYFVFSWLREKKTRCWFFITPNFMAFHTVINHSNKWSLRHYSVPFLNFQSWTLKLPTWFMKINFLFKDQRPKICSPRR